MANIPQWQVVGLTEDKWNRLPRIFREHIRTHLQAYKNGIILFFTILLQILCAAVGLGSVITSISDKTSTPLLLALSVIFMNISYGILLTSLFALSVEVLLLSVTYSYRRFNRHHYISDEKLIDNSTPDVDRELENNENFERVLRSHPAIMLGIPLKRSFVISSFIAASIGAIAIWLTIWLLAKYQGMGISLFSLPPYVVPR